MNKTFVILLTTLLVGCGIQNSPTPDPFSDSTMPYTEMNKGIVLKETPGMMDAYEQSGLIFLDLENASNESIMFPPDFGSKIYIKENDKWLPIGNSFGYPSTSSVLPTEEQYPLGLSVSFWPNLPATSSQSVLRIVVTGNGVDTGTPVGAYLDVILK